LDIFNDGVIMSFSSLQQYLRHLYSTPGERQSYWLDEAGRACGRYYHSTLTSTFQPLRASANLQVAAYAGYARTYAANAEGLNVWRLLEQAASDQESIELDRLCRILHVINFYRQIEAKDQPLFLTIHPRLLAGVESNHGIAFRRVLGLLELPHNNIILQLPQINASQRWILQYVAENYQRNGFRIGIHAKNAGEALELLDRVELDAIKLSPDIGPDAAQHRQLLQAITQRGARLIYKRVETAEQWAALQALHAGSDQPFWAQGFYFDQPNARLVSDPAQNTAHAEMAA
jgi:EAL domain-containing protein (putative c-di-GMP-specific phosphodiesterase class I)